MSKEWIATVAGAEAAAQDKQDAEEIVDMQMAKRAYQASAAVIRTADDMSKTLIDALA